MIQQENLIQEGTPLRREVANDSCKNKHHFFCKNKTPFVKAMEAIDIPLYCCFSVLYY